jgi:P27 family predicted phage terminase small subunit
MLIGVGMLDQMNIDLVRLYVNETMIYRQAMDILNDNLVFSDPVSGAPKAHPARRIASDAMKNIMSIAREFGLTPSTRQKIKTDSSAPTPTKKRTRKKTAADIAIEMEL